MQPFVIFSLPRSRSTWLSAALSAPGRLVGHDIGIDCASIADFLNHFPNPYVGTCETGATFAAPLIARLLPGIRFVVVLNNPFKVAARLQKLGFGDQMAEMSRRHIEMEHIARTMPHVLAVESRMLDNIHIARTIHQHINLPFDSAWWEYMASVNVQTDIADIKRKLVESHDRIAALKSEIAAMGEMANA